MDRAPHRLIAMLLGYPLVATAVALDVVWALFGRGWWPPVLYTLTVAAIACALAACSEHVIDLPSAVQVLAVPAALTMANTAMILATGEVSRNGRYPGGDTAVALFCSLVTLTLTMLICRLGEILADELRTRNLPADDLEYDWPSPGNATTRPVPNLVQLTLIDTERGQAA